MRLPIISHIFVSDALSSSVYVFSAKILNINESFGFNEEKSKIGPKVFIYAVAIVYACSVLV